MSRSDDVDGDDSDSGGGGGGGIDGPCVDKSTQSSGSSSVASLLKSASVRDRHFFFHFMKNF